MSSGKVIFYCKRLHGGVCVPALVSSLLSWAFAGVVCLVRSVFAYTKMNHRRTYRTNCTVPASHCVGFVPG